MKCVLHIGTEKTGTTLLQKWLYDNQAKLSRQKVYLSNILGKNNNRLFPLYFQGRLDDWARTKNIKTLEEKAEYLDGLLEQLSEEVKNAASSHDLFLISSEHLHSRIIKREELDEIKSFLSSHFESVHILCYFRNQADMAASHYSTVLKSGFMASLEGYLHKRNVDSENYYFNFLEIADNWSETFGLEKCTFKIYDRSRFVNGDIREDFLSSLPIELNPKKLNFKTQSSNESLSSLQGKAFQVINKYIPYWERDNNGSHELNKQIKGLIKKNPLLAHGKISVPYKEELMESFEESNRQFLQKYLSDNVWPTAEKAGPRNEKVFSLSEVEGIVESLCESLLPYVDLESSPRLSNDDAGYLRDIAIKIERKQELSTRESLQLMKLAQRAHPDGPVIKRKVREYSKRLE